MLLTGTTRFPARPGVKNILITGGAGFIASWVARHLILRYPELYTVVVFDNLDYAGSINNIRSLQDRDNYHFVYGDICSTSDVKSAIERFQIDTILHFAAQSHVGHSFKDPLSFAKTNVIGTAILLEAAREAGVSCFLHFSTDEVYGEPRSPDATDSRETAALQPTNPYSGTKAAAEMIVFGYMASFDVPIMIVRSNNAYGPCQYPEKIIPRFAMRLNAGLALPLHGAGDNTRCYLYASDLADAVDTVLHKGSFGEVYNVVSTDVMSNKELCRRLLESFDISTDESSLRRWVVQTPDRPANDSAYLVNGDKLLALGWRQKVSFNDGLKQTVDWYRQHGNRWWGGVHEVVQDMGQEGFVNGAFSGKKVNGITKNHTSNLANGDIDREHA